MNWRDLKIRIAGSKKKILELEKLLDTINLTGNESKDRLILQKFIDDKKIKERILYDGNSIISYDRIIKEYENILKKNKFDNMSNYFYDFLHLDCGSIAHYDKNGWLCEYYNLDKLKSFFNENEFGKNILNEQPYWKSDVIRIAKTILQLTNEEPKNEKTKNNQLSMFDLIA